MTHPALKFVVALVSGTALSLLAVGCGSAPTENTSQSDDDLRKCGQDGCDYGDVYKCYSGFYMGASGIEGALRAIGCTNKILWSSNGGGTGWFQVTCTTGATTYALCPLTGAYETMGVARIAQCYSTVAPYYAQSSTFSNCSSAQGGPYVAYDPTCTGTHCMTPW